MEYQSVVGLLKFVADVAVQTDDNLIFSVPKDLIGKLELLERKNTATAFLAGQYSFHPESDEMTFSKWLDQFEDNKLGDLESEMYEIMQKDQE
jgi:hypothetical protein